MACASAALNKMKFYLFLLALLLPLYAFAAEKESAYERVMRTGIMRCGYGLEMPYSYKDAETGEIKGFFHDYIELMAANLGLKVEWVEEMGWGQFPTALDTGRIDAWCTTAWRTAARAKLADSITPITYQPLYVVVRASDKRFDNKREALNSADVKFVGVEGQIELQIAQANFPQAKTIALPQSSDFSQAMMDVDAKKADALIVTGVIFAKYDQANPGKLRRVEGIPPVQVSGEGFAVKAGEHTLRRMFDNATMELLETGAIDRIVKSYNMPEGTCIVNNPAAALFR
ncbi:MAG: transporter substrate-binding domain-containing protein [Alphaproteobacteria bacterium]|nr:transporter substrate-binding domain-containing protein [Alphaproteobacteria bacterium]